MRGYLIWLLVGWTLGGCAKMGVGQAPGASPPQTPAQGATPASQASTAPTKPPTEAEVIAQVAPLLAQGSESLATQALRLLESAGGAQSSAAYYHNLGLAYQQLNRLTMARDAYQQAVRQDPSPAEAWLGLGSVQARLGFAAKATDTLHQGIAGHPDHEALRVALIGVLRTDQRLDEAIVEAKNALKVNSKSLATYNELALVYMDQGNLNMADFVFQKAFAQVDGAKDNVAVRSNLGRVRYLQGDVLRAQAELEAAQALQADYLPMLLLLAHIYMQDRNGVDAVPLLESALAQEPYNPLIMLNLGLAYRRAGKLQDAERMYNQAIAADPNQTYPYLNLGVLYGDYFKDYDRAIEAFNQYLSAGGTDRETVLDYIASVQKEKRRAAQKRATEAKKQQRLKQKAERERLLNQTTPDAKTQKPITPAP